MDGKKKNSTITTVFGLLVLMIAIISTTFAYFRAQGGVATSEDVSVTSNTTDLLSFQINDDISFRVSESNLYEGGNNVSGNATASAILTPNNKTNQATMNYYMYLNLTSNPTVYSSGNTNHDAELVLQVFDGNNQLVTLSGLGNQIVLGNSYGYDITGRQGLITLLDNHAITANNASTTENWSIVITVVNLNVDQLDNTNKTITGEVILRKDQQLDTPRLAVVVPQQTNNTIKGYVETVIEPSIVEINNVEEEVYTIYTVGYIADDTISGTSYSIDIENLGIDFSNYNLELVGTPQVMTSQADYTNYVAMKASGLPLTSLSNGDTTSANATAQDLYTYSLNTSELTIDDVNVICTNTKCTVTISQTFNNISGKSKHATTNSNNEAINVLYNGIKFNLRKNKYTYSYWRYQSSYSSNQIPSIYYTTRDYLLTENDLLVYPYFIRTTMVNGNPVGHEACLWNNNLEYCITNNYWTGTLGEYNSNAGQSTMNKIKSAMESALNITLSSSACSYSSDFARCDIGNFGCYTRYNGNSGCNHISGAYGAFVNGSGDGSWYSQSS